MISGSAAVLLSRQALHPCGSTPWVVQTIRAISFVKQHGWTVLTSCGMQTWELVTALSSSERLPLRLYAIADGEYGTMGEKLISEFGLDLNLTEFVFLNQPDISNRESMLAERDRRIIADAETLIPISIREGGNLHRLLEAARGEGRKIVEDYRISYKVREQPLAYGIRDKKLSTEIQNIRNEYITHWTRACNGPWPGERPADYYAELIRSERYPRMAMDTLGRIVTTRRIMGSSRHMPGETATVSFSSLAPMEVPPLMRWRARYRQMSFEPYGIGIRREKAAQTGLQPVEYFDRKHLHENSPAPPWLRQSIGVRSDWRAENEYRCLRDFEFSGIPDEDLVLFCHTREEAAQLEHEFKLRTVPFTD
jgi:hypothetical protein